MKTSKLTKLSEAKPLNLSSKYYKFIEWFIKLAVFAACLFFLYHIIFVQHDVNTWLNSFISISKQRYFFFKLFILLVFMLLNWGIEAKKWQMLMQPIEKLDFIKAFKAVLLGLSVSILSPNRTGEFAGRILFIEQGSRFTASLATFVGSIAQVLTTLIFGVVGIVFWIVYFNYLKQNYFLISLVIIICLLLLFLFIWLYLKIHHLEKLTNWNFLKKFKEQFSIFTQINDNTKLHALLYSILRYLVFLVQYIIILKLCEVQVNVWHMACIIMLMYGISTFIPSFTLVEMGVRGAVSVYFFGIYISYNAIFINNWELGVINSAFLIWLINIAIPAFTGIWFQLKLKYFPKSMEKSIKK